MRVTVSEDGSTVSFRLSALQVPFAFKRRLAVPTDKITAAESVPRAEVPHGPLIRAPGAHIPGLIRYGSYGRKPNRQFWVVNRHDPVLVVDIEDWDYARIVAGVADAGRAAGYIKVAMT